MIYADVLFLINLLVDFFLLHAVSSLWHYAAPRWRLLCGAAAGAACAVCAVYMPLSLSFWWTFPASAATVAAAFSPCSRRAFLRACAGFYLLSFFLAGMLLLVWQVWHPKGLYIQNNVLYYPIPLPVFFILLCLFYGVLVMLTRFTGPPEQKKRYCRLCVQQGENSIWLQVKMDTGCALREPFSGLPVLVGEAAAMESILPLQMQDYFSQGTLSAGLRLIPYEALGGSGLLPAFPANVQTEEGRSFRCWVAVTEKPLGGTGFSAVMDPAALHT